MPEGHTIHRLARDLDRDLVGGPVHTDVRQDRFRASAAALDGRSLEATSANGKHLFLHWDGGEVLHVHLGLVGKFRRRRVPAPEPSPALRLRLLGSERAWDLTGPMTCELVDPGVVDRVAAKLGPDPLRDDADPERFVAKVQRSRRAIGDLLLDQAVIAGLGNVYRAELLHLAGVHPEVPGRSLDADTLHQLWDLAVEQLRSGVRRNRIVTVPLDGRRASSIRRREAVHVYKQERCRTCTGALGSSGVGGRTIAFCPRCQPAA